MMSNNVFVVSMTPQPQRKNRMEEHGGTKKMNGFIPGQVIRPPETRSDWQDSRDNSVNGDEDEVKP